jgi:hypothetical protein
MKNIMLKGTITAIIIMLSSLANAALLYDNGVATEDSGRCAETSGICNGTWTIFDDFVISADSEITSISWTANLYGGQSDYNSSNVWVYDNDPVFNSGNLLFAYSAVGTLTANSLGSGFFDITLGGLSEILSAGSYWLGIQHDTTANYATVASTGFSDNATQWQNGGAGARLSGQPELAFTVDGNAVEVSAPSAIAILGLGLLMLSLRRFKK